MEYAIFITNAWQNRDLGNIITDFCMEIANKWKLKQIVVKTTNDNHRMVSLFRERGFRIEVNDDNTTVEVEKEL